MQSGIINVYKEKGFTSFDVVAKLRGILHIKKIGHTGTLDPQAEGVLPICTGKATKACSMLIDTDKTYEVTMLLGKATDTYDIYGNVTAEKEVSATPEEVEEVIKSFVGTIEQIPPMYSAIKVNGKKLYELAREGKVIERKSRRVTIYNEETLSIDIPRVRMRVDCSKGTYIRSLCNDIGEELGCFACMEDLVRTKAGIFRVEESYRLSEIEDFARKKQIENIILPVNEVFNSYPKRYISDKYKKVCINGAKLSGEQFVDIKVNQIQPLNLQKIADNSQKIAYTDSDNGEKDNQMYRIYLEDGTFVGLYRNERGTYIPEKMFYEDI